MFQLQGAEIQLRGRPHFRNDLWLDPQFLQWFFLLSGNQQFAEI